MNILLLEQVSKMIEPLGWVLVHFLWQGTLIASALYCLLLVQRRASAKSRYCSTLAALVAMTTMPFVTLAIPALSRPFPEVEIVSSTISTQQESIANPEPISDLPATEMIPETSEVEPTLETPISEPTIEIADLPANAIPAQPQQINLSERMRQAELQLRPWLKGVVIFWFLGVLLLSTRLVRLWNQVQQLRRVGIESVPDDMLSRLEELARRLGIRLRVNLLLSKLVEVPTLIGWLQPVILLPAAAVTGLTPSQLDAILVHELAHIRRHDYLVNLLQSTVETLLFYHPAVWWISTRLRVERENCCDDLTVNLLGDPLNYGRALLALEEQRRTTGNPALALGSQGGSLLGRIERLVMNPQPPIRRSSMGTSLSVLVGSLFLGGVMLLAVRGEVVHGETKATEELGEDLSQDESESIPEKVVQRFEMIFFQDQERRTIPAVTFQLGDNFYAVLSGGATIPSDGVEHAIDRMFLKFDRGIDYNPRYQQKVCTPEFFVYRTRSLLDEIPSLRLEQTTPLAIGDHVSISGIGTGNSLFSKRNAARVSAVEKEYEIIFHEGKSSHFYQNLTEIDRRFPEGTIVFHDGKLAGIVIVGARFLPRSEQRSLIVPAERIVSAIRPLSSPEFNEQNVGNEAKDKTDEVELPEREVFDFSPNKKPPILSLKGEIQFADGNPVRRAILKGVYINPGPVEYPFSIENLEINGTFSIQRRELPLWLHASSQDGKASTLTRVEPDMHGDLKLTLQPTANVKGILVDAEGGQPLSHLKIEYGIRIDMGGIPNHLTYGFGNRIETDDEGRFSLPDLVVGAEWTILRVEDHSIIRVIPIAKPGEIDLGTIQVERPAPKQTFYSVDEPSSSDFSLESPPPAAEPHHQTPSKPSQPGEKSKTATEPQINVRLPSGERFTLLRAGRFPRQSRPWWSGSGEVLTDETESMWMPGTHWEKRRTRIPIPNLDHEFQLEVECPAEASLAPRQCHSERAIVGNAHMDGQPAQPSPYKMVRYRVGMFQTLSPEEKTTTLQIDYSNDPWEHLLTVTPEDIAAGKNTETSSGNVSVESIKVEKGRASVVYSHPLSDNEIYQGFLIDETGTGYVATGDTGKADGKRRSVSAEFSFQAGTRIKEIRVQRRQMQHIEFRNVSLLPNEKTEVEIYLDGKKYPHEKDTESSGSAPDTGSEQQELQGQTVVARVGNAEITAGDLLYDFDSYSINAPTNNHEELNLRESVAKAKLPGEIILRLRALGMRDYLKSLDETERAEAEKDLQIQRGQQLQSLQRFLESKGKNAIQYPASRIEELVLSNAYFLTFVQKTGGESDGEVRKYYEAHPEKFQRVGRARWQQILVKNDKHGGSEAAKKIALDAMEDLKTGLDFGEGARKYSDSVTASAGGHWGWSEFAGLSDNVLSKQLSELPVGETSKVLPVTNGWQIVKVLERIDAGTIPFLECHERVEEALRKEADDRTQVRYPELLDGLLQKYPVWTIYGELDKADAQSLLMIGEVERMKLWARQKENIPNTSETIGTNQSKQEKRIQNQISEQTNVEYLILDREIRINQEKEPLERALQQLIQGTLLQIQFDEDALRSALISKESPVSIKLDKVRLRTALDLILEQLRLTWTYRDGTILITTPSAAKNQLIRRSYSVAGLLLPDRIESAESLMKLLTNTIEPGSWDERGSNGRIEFDPKTESLSILQTATQHMEIDAMLSQVRSLVSLNQPVTIEFDSIQLPEAIDKLSEMTGTALYIDPLGLAEAEVKPDARASLKAQNTSLRSALTQLLAPLRLSFRPDHQNEIVRITSLSRASGKISTRTYEASGNIHDLMKEILKKIDPSSWDLLGGEGRIEIIEQTQSLVIRQSEDNHALIRQLLDNRRIETNLKAYEGIR